MAKQHKFDIDFGAFAFIEILYKKREKYEY